MSAIGAMLGNELYRGRFIWNRSRWVREPGSRRRRRVPRPEAEWVAADRPDLRIVDDPLWARVQARRARVRTHYEQPAQFGKSRAEYGTYLLSGLLVCGMCTGTLSIRSGSQGRGDQRYGCTRHWRRGPAACGNNLLVRRDLAEERIGRLLQEKLYTPEAVERLVDLVNARLRGRQGTVDGERARLLGERDQVNRRLDGLRRFIEQGDGSARVREWLREAEQQAAQIEGRLGQLNEQERPASLQVHPAKVRAYLDDLRGTLTKGGARPRQLLQADIERIVVHPIRAETAKPFARAEVVTTGKGLLARVAFVVAGGRKQRPGNRCSTSGVSSRSARRCR